MAYLIGHVAISLLFTMLLGLLLGWLLWGYVAQQRSKEIQSLRNRIADMQLVAARTPVPSFPSNQSRMSLSDVSNEANTLIEGELPERPANRNPFFEDEEADTEPVDVPVALPPTPLPPPIAPDLEAEVKEARLQHLQQQVRELESLRDRLPLLQADLSDALAGRRAAESRFQEAKNDFEVRSSSLLSQIRDFENAAVEWDRTHEQLQLERLASEKELSSVKATLRDLQNSQRPQTVDLSTAPTASAIELADLRERYQRALRERDSIAVELEFWKQSDGERPSDSARLPELEEAIRTKDAQLAEQAARVESLLWHVAELEPFAAEAPQKEEDLRRQESEIAGHMAMHSENAERIRSLQNHIVELEATTVPADELQKTVADHQANVNLLSAEHAQRLNELEQTLAAKDDEIAEHVSARYADVNLVNNLQARIAELEIIAKRISGLEKLLAERDTEIRGLLSAHSEMQHEMQTWKTHATELEPIVSIVPELQSALEDHAAELKRLKESHSDKESQIASLQESLAATAARLAAHQQRLPEMEQQLKVMGEQHQGEVTRLKVNSAQRIRRLRQSINNFR